MIIAMLSMGSDTIMAFLTPILLVVAPFIIQFIKNTLKLQGQGAVLVAFVISIVLAMFGGWATNTLDWSNGAALFAEIFTVSTLIYKFVFPIPIVQESLPETLKKT